MCVCVYDVLIQTVSSIFINSDTNYKLFAENSRPPKHFQQCTILSNTYSILSIQYTINILLISYSTRYTRNKKHDLVPIKKYAKYST